MSIGLQYNTLLGKERHTGWSKRGLMSYWKAVDWCFGGKKGESAEETGIL